MGHHKLLNSGLDKQRLMADNTNRCSMVSRCIFLAGERCKRIEALEKQPLEAATIEEGIRVCVAFDNRKVLPLWFRWRGRYYKVESVSFTWNSNRGSARLHYYAVTDGVNTYELCFNSRTLEWTLGRVYAE